MKIVGDIHSFSFRSFRPTTMEKPVELTPIWEKSSVPARTLTLVSSFVGIGIWQLLILSMRAWKYHSKYLLPRYLDKICWEGLPHLCWKFSAELRTAKQDNQQMTWAEQSRRLGRVTTFRGRGSWIVSPWMIMFTSLWIMTQEHVIDIYKLKSFLETGKYCGNINILFRYI